MTVVEEVVNLNSLTFVNPDGAYEGSDVSGGGNGTRNLKKYLIIGGVCVGGLLLYGSLRKRR